ncbi:hypothetical protein E2562_016513 [Oryza meyeriana var. granulata]|uniref:Uncharacterized protein n=1 Tax=Oryza meyeriana var. granulata TaxID=110450 RepID=A0A6G1C5Q0_9ORYZ|nr:hypothetical protein E2562_016513 [Oryza meyeriana var. granulata]
MASDPMNDGGAGMNGWCWCTCAAAACAWWSDVLRLLLVLVHAAQPRAVAAFAGDRREDGGTAHPP